MKQIIIALFSAVCAYGQSVSVIGNTGLPTTTTGAVPFLIPGVAVDSSGKIYTVHDWMESHQDIVTWNSATGQKLSNTGNFDTYYLYDAIAVEPDGSATYVTGWIGNAPTRTLAIWKFDPVNDVKVPFSSGPNIQVSTSSTTSLLPIALSGSTLWVADHDGNRIVSYDKVSGAQTGSFPVAAPQGIAIDSRNHLWIITATAVQIYSTNGTLLRTPIANLANAYSISLRGNVLAIADRGANSVLTYSIVGWSGAKLTHTFSGFAVLWSVALDPSGNLIVTDSIGPNGGGRIQKLDPCCSTVFWTQTCTEFQSDVAYSPANPGVFISLEQQTYNVDRSSMTTDWAGAGSSFNSSNTGPIKVLNLGGNDFEFVGCQRAQVAIYRVNQSLAQVGSVTPPQPGTDVWITNSYSVDDSGGIWLADAVKYHAGVRENAAAWRLPLSGLDANGNPTYDWTTATDVISETQILSALGVGPFPIEVDNEMTVFSSVDNLVYMLVYSPTTGVSRGGAWMAGNTLMAFHLDGTLAWKVALSAASVGLCPVPTGGVLTGDNTGPNGSGVVRRYSNVGALLTSYAPPASLGTTWPDNPCGAFDMFGAINCQLAPDGLLDIFCEDDYNGRVIWWHVAP